MDGQQYVGAYTEERTFSNLVLFDHLAGVARREPSGFSAQVCLLSSALLSYGQ